MDHKLGFQSQFQCLHLGPVYHQALDKCVYFFLSILRPTNTHPSALSKQTPDALQSGKRTSSVIFWMITRCSDISFICDETLIMLFERPLQHIVLPIKILRSRYFCFYKFGHTAIFILKRTSKSRKSEASFRMYPLEVPQNFLMLEESDIKAGERLLERRSMIFVLLEKMVVHSLY